MGILPVLVTARTLKSFAATALAQGAATLGGMALASLLARVEGAEGLGRFTVMLSLLGVLGMVARRGQSVLVTRNTASEVSEGRYSSAKVYLLFGLKSVVLSSLIFGIAGALVLWSGILGMPYPGATVVFPLVLPILTFLAVFAGYERGMSRPWRAPIFENGGVSLASVVLLLPLYLMCGQLPVGSVVIAFLMASSLLVCFATMSVRWDTVSVTELLNPTKEHRHQQLSGQFDFTVIAFSGFVAQTGMFMFASAFLSSEEIGLLRAAERLALIVVLPTLVIKPIISPSIVSAIRQNEFHILRRTLRAAALVSAAFGLLVTLMLVAWSEAILVNIMGAEFREAAAFLIIMALTQLLAAVFSPFSTLLNMSGHERITMRISVGTLAVALVMLPVLCVTLGPMGFVITYSVSVTSRAVLIGLAPLFLKNLRAESHMKNSTVQELKGL